MVEKSSVCDDEGSHFTYYQTLFAKPIHFEVYVLPNSEYLGNQKKMECFKKT